MRTNAELSVGSLHDQHGNVASHEVAMLIKLADDGPKAAGSIKRQKAKLRPRLQKVPMPGTKRHAAICLDSGELRPGKAAVTQPLPYLYVKME